MIIIKYDDDDGDGKFKVWLVRFFKILFKKICIKFVLMCVLTWNQKKEFENKTEKKRNLSVNNNKFFLCHEKKENRIINVQKRKKSQ